MVYNEIDSGDQAYRQVDGFQLDLDSNLASNFVQALIPPSSGWQPLP